MKDSKRSLLTNELSWNDLFKPDNVDQVPIHHSKKQAIKTWLTSSVSPGVGTGSAGGGSGNRSSNMFTVGLKGADLFAYNGSGPDQYNRSSTSRAPPSDGLTQVLIVYGSSGVGKSTLIELMCRDQGVVITRFSEHNLQTRYTNGFADAENSFGGYVGGTSTGNRSGNSNSNRFADQVSEQLLHCQYRPLACVTAAAAAGAGAWAGGKGVGATVDQRDNGRLLLLEDPSPVLSEHTRSSISTDQTSSFTNTNTNTNTTSPSTVLWDTIKANRYRPLKLPVVLIVSDEDSSEKCEDASVIKKYIPAAHIPYVQPAVVHIPATTELALVKLLNKLPIRTFSQRARSAEDLGAAVSRIAASSGGDIRHSLLQFQLFVTSGNDEQEARKKSGVGASGEATKPTVLRGVNTLRDDASYRSPLLGVGKLLHLRLNASGHVSGISPDLVLAQCCLDAGTTAAFLQSNCIRKCLCSSVSRSVVCCLLFVVCCLLWLCAHVGAWMMRTHCRAY